MKNELRLWSVEIYSAKRRNSPSRPSLYSTTVSVNVAAPDIFAAIHGAFEELRERYGDEFDEEGATVTSATHKGRVNRIVE